MKSFLGIDFIFRLLVGVLFFVIGIIFLALPLLPVYISVWIFGMVLAAILLAQLIVASLSKKDLMLFSYKKQTILTGIFELLFGLLLLIDNFVYIDNLWIYFIAWLAIMGVLKTIQFAAQKRRDENGLGITLIVAVVFFIAALGIILTRFVLDVDLFGELLGAAVFVYGVFVICESFLKSNFNKEQSRLLPDEIASAEPAMNRES